MNKLQDFIKARFAMVKEEVLASPGDNQLQKATVAYELMSVEHSICNGAIFYASHTNQITEVEEEAARVALSTTQKELETFVNSAIDTAPNSR